MHAAGAAVSAQRSPSPTSAELCPESQPSGCYPERGTSCRQRDLESSSETKLIINYTDRYALNKASF